MSVRISDSRNNNLQCLCLEVVDRRGKQMRKGWADECIWCSATAISPEIKIAFPEHPHWPKAVCTQSPRVSTCLMRKSRNTKDTKSMLNHSLPSSLLPGFYLLYFLEWFVFIQILELNILSATPLAAFWSSNHMPGTILGSVYTMMKKTKVIPNFMELIFRWGNEQGNKYMHKTLEKNYEESTAQ